MTFREEFSLLLRACYPLLYIPTLEEERVEGAIAQCAANLGQRTVYTWDFVDGYQDNPNNTGFGKRNPLQALEFIEKLPPISVAFLSCEIFSDSSKTLRSPGNCVTLPVVSRQNRKIL